MKKNAIWAMFTMAGLLAAQSAGDLFQQGLRKERSEGDYAAAIRLYERTIKAAGQDRKLAAQALLRIGECQERQGGEAARRTYERLTKEYADQPQVVAEARARMGAMSAPASSGPRLR